MNVDNRNHLQKIGGANVDDYKHLDDNIISEHVVDDSLNMNGVTIRSVSSVTQKQGDKFHRWEPRRFE